MPGTGGNDNDDKERRDLTINHFHHSLQSPVSSVVKITYCFSAGKVLNLTSIMRVPISVLSKRKILFLKH